MRVIDAFDRPVQAVAVSADGRFLAATSTGHALALWHWAGCEPAWRIVCPGSQQLGFSPDGVWVASCGVNFLRVWPTDGRPPVQLPVVRGVPFAGGVAFTPDAKHLVASRDGSGTTVSFSTASHGQLARWFVPTWQRVPGFDDHLPVFPRLAVSSNGQYVVGINPLVCELRFVVSGGLQARVRMGGRGRHAFVSFSPDSQTLVCGWDAELHVVETLGGRGVRQVNVSGAPFRDAAFTGTGRHVGTVDGTAVLQLWDVETWAVERAYDWNAGALTCLAFSADGLAGVCGTDRGQLVLFDLD
ncbi:MAG: domain, G-beta repeat [Gemmataceae bacterium]|nr:domain, G-beta repeat [Gemmataceae bacterium]